MTVTMTIEEFLKRGQYVPPKNTPTTPWLDVSNCELVKALNEFNNNTKDFFENISKLAYYFSHPKTLAWVMWSGLVKYSFWICLFICLLGIIGYIIGWKKGKEWAKGSVMAYVVITMLNSAL